MSYQLASLLVSFEAERSKLTAVLDSVRAELKSLDQSSGTVTLNVAAPDSTGTAASIARIREQMAKITVPDVVPESLKKADESVRRFQGSMGRAVETLGSVPQKATTIPTTMAQATQGSNLFSNALGFAQNAASGLLRNLTGVRSGNWQAPGLPEVSRDLKEGGAAAGTLFEQLSKLTGLNLSNIAQLASLGGMGVVLTDLARKFMSVSDEAKILPLRLSQAGIAANDVMGEVNKMRDALVATGTVTRDEVTRAIEQAATKGPEKFRDKWKETVQTALALNALNEKGIDYNVRLINLGQLNYSTMDRMLRQVGIMLRPHATLLEYQNAINQAAERGREIMAAKQDTFEVQVRKIGNALEQFRIAMANAIGPALVAPLRMIGEVTLLVTERVKRFVEANRELVNWLVRIAATAALAMGAKMMFSLALTALGPILGMVTGLFGPLISVMTSFRLLTITSQLATQGLNIAMAAMRLAVIAAGNAVRGALIGTGIGAILVLAGALIKMTGVLDDWSGGMTGLMGMFQNIAKPMIDWFAGVWKFINREFQVFVAAFVSGVKSIWDAYVTMIGQLADFLARSFGMNIGERVGGVLDYAKEKFEQFRQWLFGVWQEITAELSVAGLRVRQYYLLYEVLAQNLVPIARFIGELFTEVARWMWTVFSQSTESIVTLMTTTPRIMAALLYDVIAGITRWLIRNGAEVAERIYGFFAALLTGTQRVSTSFWTWLQNNWRAVLMSIGNIFYGWLIGLFGWIRRRLGDLWEFIKDPKKWASRGFDFSETHKEIAATKESIKDIFSKEFKMPQLKLSGPAMDEMNRLQREIDERKRKFKEEQDAFRREFGREKSELDKKKEGLERAGDAPLGKRIAGGFSDLLGQWKKVQEAAVSGNFVTLEEIGKRQHAEQRAGNVKLDEVNANLRRIADGGGMVPPGPPIPA